MEDVGLCGTTSMPLKDGFAQFQRLQFDSTSYIHQGQKFHLVLCVFFKETHYSSLPKILFSCISTGIFVDSRKTARIQNNKVSDGGPRVTARSSRASEIFLRWST